MMSKIFAFVDIGMLTVLEMSSGRECLHRPDREISDRNRNVETSVGHMLRAAHIGECLINNKSLRVGAGMACMKSAISLFCVQAEQILGGQH
jgi:hypothetical protein